MPKLDFWVKRLGRGRFIVGMWILTAVELMSLFAMTKRVHTPDEFVAGIVLILATLGVAAITIFSIPAHG